MNQDITWVVIPLSVFLIGTLGLYLHYVKNYAQRKKKSFEAAFRMMNGMIVGSITILLVISYAFGELKGLWAGLGVVFVFMVLTLGLGSFFMEH